MKRFFWWLRRGKPQQQTDSVAGQVTKSACQLCNGSGMVRYYGQHPDGEMNRIQWARECDLCRGTGQLPPPPLHKILGKRTPQAIAMPPGWRTVGARTDPRPLRMQARKYPAPVTPISDAPATDGDLKWDDEAKLRLQTWFIQDAQGGDETA